MKIRKVILILGVVIFTVSLIFYINTENNLSKSEKVYEELRLSIIESNENSDSTENVLLNKYSSIKAENEDLVGWLSDNNYINYPIVCNMSDDLFYLHHDFYKNYAYAGCLFIDGNYTINDKVIIVYGHNMRNNTMFGSLDEYCNESMLNSSMFYFSNLYKDIDLKPIAVCNLGISDFDYYNYQGNLDSDSFSTLISNLSKSVITGSLDNTDYSNNLVILSTCEYSHKDGRLLIICKY